MRVLVLNSGSSTLKASLVDSGSQQTLATVVESLSLDAGDEALRRILTDAIAQLGIDDDVHRPAAVGYRVVHGGTSFVKPVVVDDGVLARLADMADFAPLHNSTAVAVIKVARDQMPDVPHVACFDTAFHAGLPEVARRYPVPSSWSDWGVRRFGFHGLSVEWSVREAARILGLSPAETSIVVAHLGSGCSVTAIKGGRSAWTSMGFTPLEGLMMGTRSGSIDPGAMLYLLRSGRVSVEELDEILQKTSGLLGVSLVSADMRQVRSAADAGDENARLAVDMFVARAAESVAGAMTWTTAQAIVFTGGIGEHDDRTRAAICERLAGAWGTALPQTIVVAAREEVVIAQAADALLSKPRDHLPPESH